MADVHAFRAYRYDLAHAGMLSDLVAPPYDVIDDRQQQQLYDRNPNNVVRLILNKEEPEDNDANNRYTRAAKFLRDWVHDGVLMQEREPALYVYHQDFEIEGKRHTRRGFFARVRLEKFGEGKTFPHEETMPGPKADRLKLFHATGMNLSPIFSLFPDDEQEVQSLLDNATTSQLPLEATDHLGVKSRLWVITDPHVISQVAGLMQSRPIFIADGHHRYETSLRYLEEKQQAGEVKSKDDAANFTMMMLVGMSDPGLAILPTHRLVSGVGNMSVDELQSLLTDHFDCEITGKGDKAAQDSWEMIEADGGQDLLAFGTVADDTWLTARFRSPEIMEQLAPNHSPAWRGLAVAVLHDLVLKKTLGEKLGVQPQCRYVHLVREVTEAMRDKSCQLAALIAPATMQHVEDIAGHLEKMPPKSTYFYPKVLSGLVFNSLKGN